MLVYPLHPSSYCVSILCNHGTFIETKKLTGTMLLTKVQSLFAFYHFLTLLFLLVQDPGLRSLLGIALNLRDGLVCSGDGGGSPGQ